MDADKLRDVVYLSKKLSKLKFISFNVALHSRLDFRPWPCTNSLCSMTGH